MPPQNPHLYKEYLRRISNIIQNIKHQLMASPSFDLPSAVLRNAWQAQPSFPMCIDDREAQLRSLAALLYSDPTTHHHRTTLLIASCIDQLYNAVMWLICYRRAQHGQRVRSICHRLLTAPWGLDRSRLIIQTTCNLTAHFHSRFGCDICPACLHER